MNMKMTTAHPKAVVLAYHDAFHRKDRDEVRRLLADEGVFAGPLNAFTDADEFLDQADVFMRLSKKAVIKAVAASGEDVCVLYDYVTSVPSIPPMPIASWYRVKDGKIALFHTHFNPVPFIEAKKKGDVDRALAEAR